MDELSIVLPSIESITQFKMRGLDVKNNAKEECHLYR